MFGPYDILETVGQGGMGLVYRATDTSLDRIVALKVLRDDLRTNQHVVARFQREAEAFASLNHPNIVHIYSVGKVGLIPYIAMEFIDGEPLSTLMKRERRIPWKRALSIAVQVAEALESAHASHIIHRDIKPGNILVSKNDHAYVTDFGIAKILTADTQLTIEGSRLGTPQYMSPERCLNKDVTASSDLYSLGVLVFQLITGRLPYESKDPVELIRMIIKDPPNRISDFIDEVPKDADRLIAYLLEKDPQKRPPSAAEWAHLTRRVLDGKPLFEDESAFTDSLQEMRNTVATPTPFDGEPSQKNVKSIRHYWEGLPQGGKNTIRVLLILFLGYVIGGFYRIVTEPATLYSLQSLPEPDLSSWYQSSELFELAEESVGVSILAINTGSLVDLDTHWVNNDSLVFEFVDGRNFQVNLTTGKEMMLPGSNAQSIRFLASNGSSGHWFLQLGKNNDIAVVFYPAGNETPSELLIPDASKTQEFSGLYPLQDSTDFVYSFSENSSDAVTSIHFYDYQNRDSVLLSEGKNISFVYKNKKGHWYAQETKSKSTSLWFKGTDQSDAVELVTAIKPIDHQHFSSNGDVCVAVQSPSGESLGDIVLFQSDSGDTIAHMGKAYQAIWHPTEKYVLATAPDRQNTAQLWAIQGEEPFNRLQLTYLEGGVNHALNVNLDGSRVVAQIENSEKPALVVVDVKQETLQDQGL
jgi:serine/threonine protein kinase